MNTPVPETSTTLLRDVADAQHARWKIFHSRYEPMMRAYLRDRFPLLDADEIVQETMVSFGNGIAKFWIRRKNADSTAKVAVPTGCGLPRLLLCNESDDASFEEVRVNTE